MERRIHPTQNHLSDALCQQVHRSSVRPVEFGRRGSDGGAGETGAELQGGWLALARWAPSKTRNGPRWGTLLGSEWGPLGIQGAQFEKWSLFFLSVCRLYGVEKHESLKSTKKLKTLWIDQTCMLFILRRSAHRKKCMFFPKLGSCHFETVFSTTCGTLKTQNLSPGAI